MSDSLDSVWLHMRALLLRYFTKGCTGHNCMIQADTANAKSSHTIRTQSCHPRKSHLLAHSGVDNPDSIGFPANLKSKLPKPPDFTVNAFTLNSSTIEQEKRKQFTRPLRLRSPRYFRSQKICEYDGIVRFRFSDIYIAAFQYQSQHP